MNSTEPSDYYVEEDTISFSEIILIISHRIKFIITLPTIVCGLTIIYVLFVAKPIYISTSKIMSSSNGGSLSQAASIAAQLGIAIPQNLDSDTKWFVPEVLKSRTLAKSILYRKYDTAQFGPQKTLLQILTFGNENPRYGIDTLEYKAIKSLAKMINVDENKKTGVYTISVAAYEPKLSFKINTALIEELDAHQREYNKNKTSKTKQFIESRIYETEKELQSTEENLKNFMDRNRRIENSPMLQLEMQRLERETTVLIGVFTTLKQQYETIKIEEVKESEYVVELDSPDIPIYKSKPNRILIVFFSVFIGLFISFAWIIIIESINKYKIKEKDKIKKIKKNISKNISGMFPFFYDKI